jgi:hypothetical protein
VVQGLDTRPSTLLSADFDNPDNPETYGARWRSAPPSRARTGLSGAQPAGWRWPTTGSRGRSTGAGPRCGRQRPRRCCAPPICRPPDPERLLGV